MRPGMGVSKAQLQAQGCSEQLPGLSFPVYKQTLPRVLFKNLFIDLRERKAEREIDHLLFHLFIH